jgi:hypothetical protein
MYTIEIHKTSDGTCVGVCPPAEDILAALKIALEHLKAMGGQVIGVRNEQKEDGLRVVTAYAVGFPVTICILSAQLIGGEGAALPLGSGFGPMVLASSLQGKAQG